MSLTTVMNQGYKLIGKKGSKSIRKDGNEYRFENKIKSGEGVLYGIQIQTQPNTQQKKDIERKMSCKNVHNRLGHAGEGITCKTAKYLGYDVTGNTAKCESCVIGKIKQKAINKTTSTDRTKFKTCVKLYMDISSVKRTSFGGRKFWVIWVDKKWRVQLSKFLQNKLELALVGK